MLGFYNAIGDADYYPNGGPISVMGQPGKNDFEKLNYSEFFFQDVHKFF